MNALASVKAGGYRTAASRPAPPRARAGSSSTGAATRRAAAGRAQRGSRAGSTRSTPNPKQTASTSARGAMSFWLSRISPPPGTWVTTSSTRPRSPGKAGAAARTRPVPAATSSPTAAPGDHQLPGIWRPVASEGGRPSSDGRPAAATSNTTANPASHGHDPTPGGTARAFQIPPRPTRLPAVPRGPSGRAANAAIPSGRTGTPPGRSRLGSIQGALTTAAAPTTTRAGRNPVASRRAVPSPLGGGAPTPLGGGAPTGRVADPGEAGAGLSTTLGQGGAAAMPRATAVAIRPPAGLPAAAMTRARTSRRVAPLVPARRSRAARAAHGRAA